MNISISSTFVAFLSIQTVYVWISINFPFFWDAAYHAQVALNIYEHHFNTIFPELNTDAGHPTLFNVYLALGWKILGKTLWISHILQLPFVWGYVYFVSKFIEKYIAKPIHWIAVVLLCCEATLTAQVMSLNPDIALLCAFFMTLYGIDTQKSGYIITGTVLLSLLSIRGWIMAIALLGISFVKDGFDVLQWKKYVKQYALFILLTLTWLYVHHLYTGRWFASQTYKSEFSLSIIPKNIVVFAFRLVDTGRIALWIVFFILLFKKRKHFSLLFFKSDFLLQSTIIVLIVFFIFFIPLTNPIGHRYFMIVYVLLILWVTQVFERYRFKKWFLSIVAVFFIAGHFWVYPVPIANGWDASLAHIPYFRLKNEVMEFAQKEHIPYSTIYTYPPLHKTDYITRLKPEKDDNLPLLNSENFTSAPYILYSNISNHFNNTELNKIEKYYFAIYTTQKRKVKVILYKKNETKFAY